MKKTLLLLNCVLFLLACQPQHPFNARDTYRIISAKSGKPIGALPIAHAMQLENRDVPTQKWRFENVDGDYGTLINVGNDMVLQFQEDIVDAGYLQVNTYSGTPQQLWKIQRHPDGSVSIRSKVNDWVLDVMENLTENGVYVIVYKDFESDNQRWEMRENDDGTLQFFAKHSGKALSCTPAPTENGAFVMQWQIMDSPYQQWNIETFPDGSLRFIAVATGKALQVSNAEMNWHLGVEMWEPNDSETQKWSAQPAENGAFKFINKSNGKYLDIMEELDLNGTPVINWEASGGMNQVWNIVKVEGAK